MSVYNMSQVAPETLSQLDVDAFLNAAVLCASASLEAQNHSNLMNPDRLTTLPADLMAPLVSTSQERWWECAYKMYHKKDSSMPLEDDIGEVRQELQRGLEVIRCIGSHGLSPVILVHLARIFHYRAQKLNDSTHPDVAALQARSELYWSVAIPLLERLLNDQTIRTNNCKLFNFEGKDMTNAELMRALEEGRLVLVDKVVRKGDDERAIEELRKLRSPEASFKQGKIYKKLADELYDNDSSEIKQQRLTLLLKSRNSFYLTLDRLRCPDVDPKHPLNAEIYNYISEIDEELKKIDPEIINHDSNKYQTIQDTDESYASAYSDEENVSYGINSTLNLSNSNMTPYRNNSRVKMASTPSRSMSGAGLNLSRSMSQEARPSPEKLEAQMRQLMSRDTVIQTIIKQNKELIESNKNLTDKLDGMMKELTNLKLEISKNTETTLSVSRSGAAAHDETVEEDYSEYYAQAMAAQQAPQPAVPKAAAFPAMPPGYCSPNLMVRPDKYQPMALPPLYPTIPYAGYGNATAQPTPPMFLPPRGYPYGAMYSGDMYAPPMDHLDSEVERMLQRMSKTPQIAPQFAPQNISQEVTEIVAPSLAAQVDKPLSSTPKAVFGAATAVPNRATSASTTPAGVPHNYQISMPSQANIPTTVNLPPLSTTLTTAISNLSSSMTAHNTSVVSTGSHNNSDLYPDQEHDPIPDFKPVIPLPAEVAVTTGEEDETTLFCARAKLFRFVEKEWKERGIGNLKILKNKEGKVRILMRREQVLKICANHYLQSDMELSPMPKTDKAWIWVANDFADEQVRLEKLCARFKTAEEAQEFKTSFDNARASLPASPPKKSAAKKSSEKEEKKSEVKEDKTSQIKLGGFSFSGKPVIQEKTEEKTKEKKVEEQQSTKPSPFAGFSFTKTDTPQQKGFVWDVKQPETPADIQMSEVKVIEYQAILKSCSGPNLDVWTETSTGHAVVLKDKPTGGVRVMVKKGSKVLCSLPVTKDNSFTQEGKVVICVLKEAGKIKSKHSLEFQNTRTGTDFIKGVTSSDKEDESKKPLSELFKPAAGSWDCDGCYTRNIAGATKCVACMSPAPQTAATTVAPPTVTTVTTQPAKIDNKKPLSELFKPAAGSWECPDCYTRNNSTATACIACCRPADNAAPVSKPEVKGIDLSTTKTFSFGLPASTVKDKPSGFNFQMTKVASEGTTGFTFGAKPAAQPPRPLTPPRAASPGASQYTFGSPGKSFGFQFHSKSPVKSPGAAEHSESEEVEQSEDVYFAPVVPLPDKIDVKTGEESEEVLYSHRAKLFRFVLDFCT